MGGRKGVEGGREVEGGEGGREGVREGVRERGRGREGGREGGRKGLMEGGMTLIHILIGMFNRPYSRCQSLKPSLVFLN